MLLGKKNAGYTIVAEALTLEDADRKAATGYVLATNGVHWVTWSAATKTAEGEESYYCWGHYFEKEQDAQDDFTRRCAEGLFVPWW